MTHETPVPGQMTSSSHRSLVDFLDRLSSADATPGGGSASALAGAMAASLVSMVCRLTLGREMFATVSAQMQDTLARSEALRARLTSAVDEDAEAYHGVMCAYALPRADHAQRFRRAQSIQAALEQATRVPLIVAADCAGVLALARLVTDIGNPSASSDAAVSGFLADAGLRGALRNVTINLPFITDAGFVAEAQAEVDRLEASSVEALNEL
jgi:formiminotetrahydrofolate cyclodeaminase